MNQGHVHNFVRAVFIMLCFAVFSSSVHAEADDEVEVNINTEYVDVHGETVKELDNHLKQYGPMGSRLGQKLKHAYGTCAYHITWLYPYVEDQKGYIGTGPIKVLVKVTYNLPRWEAPNRVPKDVVGRWEEFAKAVSAHEEKHKDIAVRIGYRVLNTLKAMPTYRTRSELDQMVHLVANQVLTAGREEQEELDKRDVLPTNAWLK